MCSSMEVYMTTATVSPKYQIVIPKGIRESLGIKPGERAQIIPYENRIEFIPVKALKKMRGFLKGIDTTVHRDENRV